MFNSFTKPHAFSCSNVDVGIHPECLEEVSVVAFHCSEREQNDLRESAAVKCVSVKHQK